LLALLFAVTSGLALLETLENKSAKNQADANAENSPSKKS